MSLFIVGTPIGNLQDITLRALETLKNLDKIYCEDTRRTRQLLAHFAISKPIDSLHQHSSSLKIDRIIAALNAGQNIAYVTDAGTPGISDPGGQLVAAARAAGVTVTPIPGVSALTSLLSVAGVPTDPFQFIGFLPTKKGRQTKIKQLLADDQPTVLFETSPRLPKLLQELIDLGGADTYVVIGRELTKQFEEIQAGLPAELLKHFQTQPPKGELTLLITRR